MTGLLTGLPRMLGYDAHSRPAAHELTSGGSGLAAEEDHGRRQQGALRPERAASALAVPRADLRADPAGDQSPLPTVAARDRLGDPPAAGVHGGVQPGVRPVRPAPVGRPAVPDLLLRGA